MSQKRPYSGDGDQPPLKKQSLAPPTRTSFADVLKNMTDQGNRGVDYYNHRLNEVTKNDLPLKFQVLDVCYNEATSTICLSGCTQLGQPVIAKIVDFKSYFYVPAPTDISQEDLGPLVTNINKIFGKPMVYRIEIEIFTDSDSPDQDVALLKVYHRPQAQSELLARFFRENAGDLGLFDGGARAFKIADSHLDLFMFELEISCLASWICIEAKDYQLEKMRKKDPRKTIWVTASVDDLHIDNTDSIQFAPLRILSADIETAVRGNQSPDPALDAVYQICCLISNYGESEPFYGVIFTLNKCAPIKGIDVLSFETEKDLLDAWKDFFRRVNPDVIIGHNSSRFDWPFLIRRAETLGVSGFDFARIKGAQPADQPTSGWFRSPWSAYRISHGRVNLDTFHCLFYRKSGIPYGLGAVAETYLGEKKEDVHFTEIGKLQRGSEEDRRRLALYCAKDTWLAFKLSQELKCLENLAKLSKEQSITLSSLFTRFPEPGSGIGFVNQQKKNFDAEELSLVE